MTARLNVLLGERRGTLAGLATLSVVSVLCDPVMVIQEGRVAVFDSRLLLQQENQYYRSASRIAAGARGGVLP